MIWDETTDFPKRDWYLEVNDENRELVNNWRINILKYSSKVYNLSYIDWEGRGMRGNWIGGVLITTEQFKKYVWNMEEEVKIGDIVKLIFTSHHHSGIKEFNHNISFNDDEIDNEIEILDIIDAPDAPVEKAYKVRCNLGITYLRRKAFETIPKKNQQKEDMSYLIEFLRKIK